MPITFNNHPGEAEIYSNGLTTKQLGDVALSESQEVFDFQKASMVFQNWIFDGYRLANSVLDYTKPVTYSIKNDIDALKIYFNRRGNTSFTYKEFGRHFEIKNGQYMMMYASELNTQILHNEGASEIFSLQLTRDKFFALVEENKEDINQFTKAIGKQKPVLFFEDWKFTKPEISSCIDDILNCVYIKEMKKLYLQSKATELFIRIVNDKTPVAAGKFIKRKSDIEKLYAIKEYIAQNFTSQISLNGICMHFSINEFKLKTGFKELFDTTVIDYLIHNRMEYSRILLFERDLTVTEVAYMTGYSSPQYFSKAFKKKYGISPGEYC